MTSLVRPSPRSSFGCSSGPRLAPASGVDIAAAIALVDDLIGRVRKMSIDLRPALLDEIGLVPALRAYLDNQSAASGVVMQLDADEAVHPPGVRLPPISRSPAFAWSRSR